MSVRRVLEHGGTVNDKDLRHVFEMYQLIQSGVNVGLDDLTLVQADGLRLIESVKNEIKEKERKKMERKMRQAGGRGW